MQVSEEPCPNFSIPNLLNSGSDFSSFACEHCKAKKVKCDKVAPRCTRCVHSGRACRYPESVPRPGPKTMKSSRRSRGRHLGPTHSQQRPPHLSPDLRPEPLNYQISADNSIAAIVDPLHDVTTNSTPHGHRSDRDADEAIQIDHGHALLDSTRTLGLSTDDMQSLVNEYFEKMTALSLFHRPSFHQKLRDIGVAVQVQALLTSMCAFVRRFIDMPKTCVLSGLSRDQVLERALQSTREALEACVDSAPPLHLLQSLILTTWLMLCKGVRGRAWRLGGECVRIAYELKLNVEGESNDWVACPVLQEERRRAWWAVWEFDVFSSTIKRLPTAIDRSSSMPCLPVPDKDWFASINSKSCLLALELNERWKRLEESGNESGWAWFICLNSYKLDAHLLSVAPNTVLKRAGRYEDPRCAVEYLRNHHKMLVNCLQCALLALPEALNAKAHILSFEPSTRQDDAWSYGILLMSAVTRYLLHRTKIFDGIFSRKSLPRIWGRRGSTGTDIQRDWETILGCAKECASILRATTIEHVKFVNPCLSNSLWFMASAILLERNLRDAKSTQIDDADFDLLRTTILRFVKICDVPRILVDTLDSLEDRLRHVSEFQRAKPKGNAALSTISMASQNSPDEIRHRNAGEIQESGKSMCPGPSYNHTLPRNVEYSLEKAFKDPQSEPFLTDVFDFTRDLGGWDFDLDLFSCPFE